MNSIEKKLENLERNQLELLSEIAWIKSIIEEDKKLKLMFLESSFDVKTFGEKIDEIISKVGINNLLYIKIMGYFDNSYVKQLKECADRVKIISHTNVKEENKNSTLFRALNRMNNYGAQIGFHPELHARIIITNNEAIIGSGDLQDRCLGGNRVDACIWTNNPEILKYCHEFFDKIWEDCDIMESSGIILNEEFDKYELGEKLNEPWQITFEGGDITIVESEDAKWKSKKCVEINSKKSITRMSYGFNDVKKIRLDYYIKQKEYNKVGCGSPFIVESIDGVKRAGVEKDIRMIYMDIYNKMLRRDIGDSSEFIIENLLEIELNRWYHIILDVDCINHTYKLQVNDTMFDGVFPKEYNSVNSIRTKYSFGDNEWKTYIGKVVIIKQK